MKAIWLRNSPALKLHRDVAVQILSLCSFSVALCLVSALLVEGGISVFFCFLGGGYCVFSFFSPGNSDEKRRKRALKASFPSATAWARMTKAPLEQLEETWGDGECFKRMKAATENTASSDNRCFLFFHYLQRNILHLGKSSLTARAGFIK